ncbi:hypothetical protein [Nocardioides sp. WS12]|uniref:hypothetical protein n=1 Tax=Nocardioides sp. WS12 TaxID=2486272 RepID=UPI0015F975A5|nr:hypothetical protein [Nocardioides sp. WS12]
MTEKITDVRIRDGHPSVPVKKAPDKIAKRLQNKHSDKILFRITPERGWWELDDLARAVLDGDYLSYHDWWLISNENAERLVAAFDAVQKTHRIEFMRIAEKENPSGGEA